ncbi:hypothetical protein DL96DRAFT_789811 [Flagelloscypha sp. PMI_526]|nr:hypothetical protein DL96DRAFT_789811 [Flagelloscypha sp. PMI_526]
MSSYDDRELNTPENFLLLTSDLAIESSVILLSGGVSYGVYLVLTLISWQTLRTRPYPYSRPTQVLRWTILFLWAIFTVSVSLQASSYMLVLRWPRLNSSTISLQSRYGAVINVQGKLQQAMYVLHPIPYMAADAVPIWRAYALWSHSRKMKTFLIIVCAVNIAVCISRSILEYLVVELTRLNGISQYLYPVQLAFSVITNGVATIAIGIRAWHHRELTKDIGRTSSSPLSILLALVEAGAFLCFTQVVNLTMYTFGFLVKYKINSPYLLAAVVFAGFGDTVAAGYPALIVIVLSYQGSLLERTSHVSSTAYDPEERDGSEMQEGGERITTIQFAVSAQPLESHSCPNSSSLPLYLSRKEETEPHKIL